MQPMTLDQSDAIIDAVSVVLTSRSPAALDQFTLHDVIHALYLRVAMEFREFGDGPKFREGLKLYSPTAWHLAFISPRLSVLKDKTTEMKEEFMHKETPESFGDFCVKIGDGPDFWRQVYTRIGMDWHDGLPYFEHPPKPKPPSFFNRLFGRAK